MTNDVQNDDVWENNDAACDSSLINNNNST